MKISGNETTYTGPTIAHTARVTRNTDGTCQVYHWTAKTVHGVVCARTMIACADAPNPIAAGRIAREMLAAVR